MILLRLGDNSNINTGNPLKTPKKTGIYRQTVCVYLNLSSNRHWWTQLGSCCHYTVTAGKPVILYLYIALSKEQSQKFLFCEITLLLWWSCNEIRWFSLHSAKSSVWASVLNVCEQLNLNVFESYLNSTVDDTTWTQIRIILRTDNVRWLMSNCKIEPDLHLCNWMKNRHPEKGSVCLWSTPYLAHINPHT